MGKGSTVKDENVVRITAMVMDMIVGTTEVVALRLYPSILCVLLVWVFAARFVIFKNFGYNYTFRQLTRAKKSKQRLWVVMDPSKSYTDDRRSLILLFTFF